jgi:hypothetical protein
MNLANIDIKAGTFAIDFILTVITETAAFKTCVKSCFETTSGLLGPPHLLKRVPHSPVQMASG